MFLHVIFNVSPRFGVEKEWEIFQSAYWLVSSPLHNLESESPADLNNPPRWSPGITSQTAACRPSSGAQTPKEGLSLV